ncbi:uncharacterized protein F5Z01DRAFT_654184 [Emericellopsis atlantica]|uniref:Uncharacterized protein n=1 Tax=Emericellopsis atlantica TaxID=2614577 RepID=A0A9P7ZN45_9HYPO|nr:uncharacterized protein F5Z01DRAFT_654184 [Emericellopsis atlantica]KAG9255169.1 hypothetical protein F5Z01DRAFT_654184 [Emericellopsis atlantica]
MLFSPAFFSLFAGASAIDIWLNWNTSNCKGSNSIHCANIGPATCCAISGQSGSPFTSIAFREIPSNWNIEMRGHQGSQCGRHRTTQTSGGRTELCMGSGPYGGGGYSFVNKRRSDTVDLQEECTDVVKPDIVAFTDGIQYNITQLDDDSLAEIVEIAASGGLSSDVPEEFEVYIMEERATMEA